MMRTPVEQFVPIITILCISAFGCVSSDGVFGCGGFVKSDVDINYSLVEVKLYTPHGSIKYQTDCAPNTGYYLIPLYDKGDYILKAEPPKGWTFEPNKVELKVDGENDACSKGEDINFIFTGFSLYGEVLSAGQKTGPSKVKVELQKPDDGAVLQTTQTEEGGKFSFANVMPGDYQVSASHPVWHFKTNKVTVMVKKDNANLGTSLVIAGYDVTGEVTGDGMPMKAVNFVLFSESSTGLNLRHCEPGAPKGFVTRETTLKPLCYVLSKDDGSFVFPEVPTGKYFLIPFYKGEHITFDVEPEKLDFEVTHGSLLLQTRFEVAGFSVSGKVLDKENGVGIPKVTVLLNGKEQTISGADGSYHLENMKRGTYQLSAKGDNIAFDEMSVEISPNTPQLPNLVASGFSMCGKVTIDRVPESLGQISSQRRIIYYPEGKGSSAVSMATDANGLFCATVISGKFVVKVHMTENEARAGLILVPMEQTVVVNNKPVLDVTFSQFRAKISGSIKCMEKCQNMEVVLDTVGRTDKQIRIQVEANHNGTEMPLVFENVMPGKYKASVVMDNWCWKDRSVPVDVADQDLTGLEFTHTGYILKCSVSHPITMNFAQNKKEKSVGSFSLERGMNRFCLAHPGVYQLTPESCHRFDKENYSYDTSNPMTLTLTAVQHVVKGLVLTEPGIKDIMITIKSSVEDAPTTVGPLKQDPAAAPAKNEAGSDSKKPASISAYSFTLWAKSGERLTISASSANILFYPDPVEVFISGDSCPGKVAELKGRRGVFIEGSVTPALQGVKITVTVNDDSMAPVVLISDANGQYRLGPLHSDKHYSVSAEKDGYILSKLEEGSMSFRAFKLGEISIQMLDEQNQALAGVLLSLSGEKQYRSNNVTGTDGHMSFIGLSPGQYFLRPMMKEYKFEPGSQMIEVQEGTTEKIKIKGSRIAFSCFGHVTSLNGEPEPGVIIEAMGTGNCSQYQEESKTEVDGAYRIRGLQPNCLYDIHLKTGEVNTHIERTAPSSRMAQVNQSDLTDINIIAFRRMNQMEVSGNVETDLQFLSLLKVRLISESQPDTPIHTISLSKSTFFFLPSLVMDNKLYILSLETTLSRLDYNFKLPSVEFTANKSHRHFTFEFSPIHRSLDQDLNQGSFLILPLLAMVIFLAYNYQKVLPFAANTYQQLVSTAAKASSSSPGSSMSSMSSSSQAPGDSGAPQDFWAPESSSVKKRAKPRKAL